MGMDDYCWQNYKGDGIETARGKWYWGAKRLGWGGGRGQGETTKAKIDAKRLGGKRLRDIQ